MHTLTPLFCKLMFSTQCLFLKSRCYFVLSFVLLYSSQLVASLFCLIYPVCTSPVSVLWPCFCPLSSCVSSQTSFKKRDRTGSVFVTVLSYAWQKMLVWYVSFNMRKFYSLKNTAPISSTMIRPLWASFKAWFIYGVKNKTICAQRLWLRVNVLFKWCHISCAESWSHQTNFPS